jgi:type III pantothenate kinase
MIGTTTVGSLQSGLYYGYLGLVDGILERLVDELGAETRVIATGGLGSLIGTASHFIKDVDEFLTLEGLRIIWDRNQSFRRDAAPKVAKTPAAAKPSDAAAKPWPPPKSPKTR